MGPEFYITLFKGFMYSIGVIGFAFFIYLYLYPYLVDKINFWIYSKRMKKMAKKYPEDAADFNELSDLLKDMGDQTKLFPKDEDECQ